MIKHFLHYPKRIYAIYWITPYEVQNCRWSLYI